MCREAVMGKEGEVENTGDQPQEFVPGASNVIKGELENQVGHRIKSVTRRKDQGARSESEEDNRRWTKPRWKQEDPESPEQGWEWS